MSNPVKTMGTFRRLFDQVKPTVNSQKWVLTGGFSALLAETLLRLLEPWPLKYVIDEVLPAAQTTTSPAFVLGVIAITLMGIIGLRALAAYTWTIAFALAGNRVLLAVRAKAFNHLQLLSLRFHDRSRKGDLLARLIEDVGMVRDVVVTAMMPLLGNLLLLIVMLGVMMWLNWRLTGIVLLALPALALLSKSKTTSIRGAAREQRKRVGQLAATASESLASIRTVQALDLGKQLSTTFGTANNQDLKSGIKVKRLTAGMERSVDVIVGTITALVLVVGVLEVQTGRLTVGGLLVFLAYLKSTAKPVRNWAKFSSRIAKSHAGAERILQVLEEAPEVVESPLAIAPEPLRGDLEFRNVWFGYDPNQPVLRNLNLHIRAGEKVALVGGSGTGKSTTLALALRLHDPDKGQIFLGGHALPTLTLASARGAFAVVLQDPILFYGSVRENIAQGLNLDDPTIAQRVEQAAQQALVCKFTDAWQKGLDTPIGEAGTTLSNGQKQRISLARALLSPAPFVLLDEPTTALDQATRRAIESLIYRQVSDRACLWVTHDLSLALRADRILELVDGRIHESTRADIEVRISQQADSSSNKKQRAGL